MRLSRAALTVERLDDAAGWYADVLGLPVQRRADEAVVEVGRSTVVLRQGPAYDGVHHLAFGIPPADFQAARGWLAERVEVFRPGGSDVVVGPDGWDSLSVYFPGPEGVVLELIARQADAAEPGSGGPAPRVLCLSEVGVAVPDVAAAVAALGQRLGLPPFPPQGERFAPVGDHDGLLIVVEEGRVWFPTPGCHAARGPLEVLLEGPPAGTTYALGEATTVAWA